MKLYFFHSTQNNSSIYSKIKNQIYTFDYYKEKGLLESFFAITDTCLSNECAIFETGAGSIKYRMSSKNTKLDVIYNWRFARLLMFKKALRYININKYTHIYFRRAILDDLTISFFKKLKKIGVQIIYEIPTFPYDQELEYVRPLIKKLDFKYRSELKKYVDIVVTPSPLKAGEKIFGIDVLYIPNGIAVELIKETRATLQNCNTISAIGVAGLASWHAYERFIEGLREYYENHGDRNIVFHIVGGNENNEYYRLYKELVDKYSLSGHVILHGTKYGQELDEIFDNCNVGIEALGNSRKGIQVSSSLKTREYTARGLPVVASGKIDVYSDQYQYVMYVPEDESSVDICKFIEFYDKIYPNAESYKEVHDYIRSFAKESCDMRQLMLPIINYISLLDDKNK